MPVPSPASPSSRLRTLPALTLAIPCSTGRRSSEGGLLLLRGEPWRRRYLRARTDTPMSSAIYMLSYAALAHGGIWTKLFGATRSMKPMVPHGPSFNDPACGAGILRLDRIWEQFGGAYNSLSWACRYTSFKIVEPGVGFDREDPIRGDPIRTWSKARQKTDVKIGALVNSNNTGCFVKEDVAGHCCHPSQFVSITIDFKTKRVYSDAVGHGLVSSDGYFSTAKRRQLKTTKEGRPPLKSAGIQRPVKTALRHASSSRSLAAVSSLRVHRPTSKGRMAS